MNVLHFNILTISLSCLLLIGGYATNQRPAGVAAMFIGVIGMLLNIAANIYASLYGWPFGG